MNKYEQPKYEVILLTFNDVITTSDVIVEDGNWNFDGWKI